MQRMSDMLTRWLDGNLRQNHANDSTGGQSEPAQQSSEASQEPAQEQTGAQSVSSAQTGAQSITPDQTVSMSNESVIEGQPVQQTVENNVSEISTTESETRSVYMDVDEDLEPSSRPEGNSAIENISSSDSQIDCSVPVKPLDQSNLPGTSGYKDACSPDSNKDSSDTKSDESQASFVFKIASMEMDDSDNIEKTDVEAIGDSSSEYLSADNTEDSNIVPDDPKSLPYNPLFPTVYGETVGKSMDDSKQSDDDKHVCDDFSVNEAPSKTTSENEMRSNFELDKTEAMICDTACDMDNDKVTNEPRQNVNEDEMLVNKETVIHADRGTSTEQAQCAESSTQTPFDERTLTLAAEQTMIRQTMEAAVETLRERNLEPVISLHYSSESSTNSTITLGFVNFGDLHDPSSVTESPVVSVQSGVSLPVAPINLGATNELHASENSGNSEQEAKIVREKTADSPSSSRNEVGNVIEPDVKTPDSETSHQNKNNLKPLNRSEICDSSKSENLQNVQTESFQESVSSKSVEPHPHTKTDILDEDGVHVQSGSTSNYEENRDSCIKVGENDDLSTDNMLHSGIIVKASDNEKNGNPDTTTNFETIFPQQSHADHVTENESSSPRTSGTQKFSIPDVAVTDSQNDSESVEGAERATDSVMSNDDNSSDFDRVLDEVLGSSDSDSQPGREERLQAVRRHRVEQMMSGTG